MYEILGLLYKEMFQLFDPDVFHFGGDEVATENIFFSTTCLVALNALTLFCNNIQNE